MTINKGHTYSNVLNVNGYHITNFSLVLCLRSNKKKSFHSSSVVIVFIDVTTNSDLKPQEYSFLSELSFKKRKKKEKKRKK